jgi:hypothetical protein
MEINLSISVFIALAIWLMFTPILWSSKYTSPVLFFDISF